MVRPPRSKRPTNYCRHCGHEIFCDWGTTQLERPTKWFHSGGNKVDHIAEDYYQIEEEPW